MVELKLPKNSTINNGKIWPEPENSNNVRKFRVYRWNPDDEKNPAVDTYYVDMDSCGYGFMWSNGSGCTNKN